MIDGTWRKATRSNQQGACVEVRGIQRGEFAIWRVAGGCLRWVHGRGSRAAARRVWHA